MSNSIMADESAAGLKTAAGYSKSAHLLMKYVGKTRSDDVIASMVVLQSLALEIYLKHLYTVEYHKPYDGHHLKQIFDALSEGTRRKITDSYNRSLAESDFIKQILAKHQEIKKEAPQLDLDHVLEKWSEAMSEWRYFFEPSQNVVFLTFGEMEKALLQSLSSVSAGTETGAEPELKSAA
jgi:hypothetical protein